MSRLAGVVAAGVTALALALAPVAAASAVASGTVDPTSSLLVELDTTAVDVGPGEKTTFRSTVRNTGDRPLAGLIAHLNILSSDPGVYVDPEDWLRLRTQYLDELAPGDSVQLSWTVQAVTSGPLVLYVAVTDPSGKHVTASAPLDMAVGGQRVVDSATVLPLVTSVPAGVLVLLVATRVRRRRHR